MHAISGRARTDRGAAAVEFAIVVPLLLLILFALVDFGRMFFVQVSLNAASREGARASSVGLAASQIDALVQASSPGTAELSTLTSGATLTIARQPCSATTSNELTSVTVSVPFSWFTPLGVLQFYDANNPGPGATVLASKAEMLCVG